jgi:hypothetical protein
VFLAFDDQLLIEALFDRPGRRPILIFESELVRRTRLLGQAWDAAMTISKLFASRVE